MLKKKLMYILLIVVIGIIIYVIYCINAINNIPWRSDKDYNQIYVSHNENVDYKIFLDPQGQYRVLSQLDEDIRLQVSEYMKSNNLKLKEGEHSFNRTDPSFEELINNDFTFVENK